MVEKIGDAVFADGEDQLPGAVRGLDIKRDRRGSAEVEVLKIENAPV